MAELDPTCPDCGATIGKHHRRGCDVARCLATGQQRLSCGERHDHGKDTWTGRWPGDAECEQFGWYVQDRCTEGLGFVPCAPDAPGAMTDLNRLVYDARWDPGEQRWRLREGVR